MECLKDITIHGMLIGAAGAGKSSLVNSLTRLCSDYSPKRNYPYIPTGRRMQMGGHTMLREPVVLTNTLTIVDNRGWHDWGKTEALRELTAQIHGERTYDEDVNWIVNGDTSAAAKAQPIARVVSDKIDCLAIVINGLGGIDCIENIGKLIETCRKNLRRKPSFVITRKDKMSAEQIEHIRSSLEVRYEIDPEKIFVIKNVTTRTDVLDAESKAILTAFIEALVSDGEIGAATHRRREEQLISNIKLEEKEVEKKISDGKMELEVEKLVAAQIRINTETNRLAQLAEMDLKKGQEDVRHTREMNALLKENIMTLNALKLTQSADLHELRKKSITKHYENLLRE